MIFGCFGLGLDLWLMIALVVRLVLVLRLRCLVVAGGVGFPDWRIWFAIVVMSGVVGCCFGLRCFVCWLRCFVVGCCGLFTCVELI